MVAKHDYHMAVVAANESIDWIEQSVRGIILRLAPIKELALAHSSENYGAMRAFDSFPQEKALPEVFKAAEELSVKLESLPAGILSFYQVFRPFAQAVREKAVQAVQERCSASIDCSGHSSRASRT